MTRPRLYAASDGPGRVVVVDDSGADYAAGEIADVTQQIHQTQADICTLDSALLSRVVDAYLDAGQAHALDVAMRGSGLVGAPLILSVRRTGWGAAWRDAASIYPDSDPAAVATDLGLGQRPAVGLEAARWLAQLDTSWRAWVQAEIGAELSITLASTAARLALPRQWRTAHDAARRGAKCRTGLDDSAWRLTSRACYGGRVACLVGDDWRGEAVEYDLRSAYGWALTRPLPDWKGYHRKPWPSEPAWYDATVELDGRPGPGPLPYRDPDDATALHYPREGQWRGVWTRDELDRSGARVLQVHEVMAGRWSYDLQRPVAGWLERRELGGDLRRRLFRFLPNALAGKLIQRSTGWMIWDLADGDPPAGAVPLGLTSSAMAVPVPARYQAATFPQAGSYVTSLVRGRVWPELARHEALYSDTDSIHLPADAAPPADMGPSPGQWAEKARGQAVYYGPKTYQIGSKTAGFAASYSGHVGRSTGRKPTTAHKRSK